MRMDFEHAVERIDENILVVMFDRPEVRNARNTQMALDQLEVMRSLYVDTDGIRVVVLTARGDKAFSAGGDLKERKTMNEADWGRQHAIFEQNMMALRDCPVPVIAAVNGVAYAGGLETALNCDFIYAADRAKFALAEVKLGIARLHGNSKLAARCWQPSRQRDRSDRRPFSPKMLTTGAL